MFYFDCPKCGARVSANDDFCTKCGCGLKLAKAKAGLRSAEQFNKRPPTPPCPYCGSNDTAVVNKGYVCFNCRRRWIKADGQRREK